MKNIQITFRSGLFCVTAENKNGERFPVDPGKDTFKSRDEAQAYIDRWIAVVDGLNQIDDSCEPPDASAPLKQGT